MGVASYSNNNESNNSNELYKLEIEDDMLVLHERVRPDMNIYNQRVVMNKETFLKCFEEWIVPNLDEYLDKLGYARRRF